MEIIRSATQEIVFELVKKIYPDVMEEVLIDDFYVVDLYVPSLKLCIEVQGPHHYGIDGRATIKTFAKFEVLRKQGYIVKGIDGLIILKCLNQAGPHSNIKAMNEVKRYLSVFSRVEK